MHARWILFLQKFTFVFKHRANNMNKVADALSRRHCLLAMLQSTVTSLDRSLDLYATDEDFHQIRSACESRAAKGDFLIHDGFLFRGNQLCVPKTSFCEFLIRDLHARGLAMHTGRDKTIALLEGHFFWPKLRRDVARFVA